MPQVWEWTADCWNDSNKGNSGYGRADQRVTPVAGSSAVDPGTTIRDSSALLPLQEECRGGEGFNLPAENGKIVLRRYKEDRKRGSQRIGSTSCALTPYPLRSL